MASTIYCDESGNTGENLLDFDQPFFAYASNDYGVGEAAELLAHVQNPNMTEAKFSALKKTTSGRLRLFKLFADPRLNNLRVMVTLFDKRFMIVTKIVDVILETAWHERGEDLYVNGLNIALCNLLHQTTPVFCGSEATEKWLRTFVELVRRRGEQELANYLAAARIVVSSFPDRTERDFFDLLADEAAVSAGFRHLPAYVIEPAIPAITQHIALWGAKKSDRFDVIYDKSKSIAMWETVLRQMLAGSDEASAPIGYDRRKFRYPLRATSISPGDSLQHPQIQLADLVAGAVNHVLSCKTKGLMDELAEGLERLKILDCVADMIGPSTAVTPEELGTASTTGENPVDAIALHLFRQRQQKNDS